MQAHSIGTAQQAFFCLAFVLESMIKVKRVFSGVSFHITFFTCFFFCELQHRGLEETIYAQILYNII